MSSDNSPFLFFTARVHPVYCLLAAIVLCSGLCFVAAGIPRSAQQTQTQIRQVVPTYAPSVLVPKLTPTSLSALQALCDQGNAAMVAHQYYKAEKLYRQALPLYRAFGDKNGEASTLLIIGLIDRNTNRPAEALTNWNLVLLIARATRNKSGEAVTLNNIGLICRDTGHLSDALTNFQKALPLFRAIGDKHFEANILASIGDVFYHTGHLPEALMYYQQALSLHRFIGNKSGEASTLNSIGNIFNNTGRPAEALTYLQQTLTLYRAVGDKHGEVNALNNIAIVYRDAGHFAEALPNFQKALTYYRTAGDKSGEVDTLLSIGLVYYITGCPADALTNFQMAFSIARFNGNKSGEATALNNIGIVYTDSGRPSEALANFNQSLSISRAIGDRSDEANALFNIGGVFYKTGRPSDALTNYQQALPFYQAIDDKRNEANTLLGIGNVYDITGHTTEAIANYQKVLPLYRAISDKKGEAMALNNIGSFYYSAGRPTEALTSFRQSLSISRAIGAKSDEAKALNNIGVVYNDTDHPSEALTNFNQSLLIARAIGDKTGEANDLRSKAKTEQKFNQREAAKADYAGSIDLIEKIRTDLGGYTTAKQAYLASTRSTYAEYIDLLLTAPKGTSRSSDASPAGINAAFTLAQQTKGRALLDLLDSGQVDLNGSLTDTEKTKLRTLRQGSDALNVRLVKEGIENKNGSMARYAALQQQQRENESKLQQLTETLYAQHPDLAEKRSAKTATVTGLAPLLDADTALIEYVQTTPDHLAIFVVTNNDASATGSCQVTAKYLTVPETLAADCAAFQTSCADPRQDYRPLATALYKTLIAPIGTAITSKKRLIVCPDGSLCNVPFQALLTQNGTKETFLAERFEIDYAYSATGALAAHNERQRQQAYPISKDSLLIVANPSFGDAKRFGDLDRLPGQRPMESPSRPMESPSRPMESPSRPMESPSRPMESPSRPLESPSRTMSATLERAGGHIVALPGTQREANALHHLYPNATVLTGDAAQEGVVKKEAANFRFLHFATHGFCNDAAPMLSSLVLAQPDAQAKAAGDDGFLTARELFDLHLPNTELVTLSACNTGRGDIQSGEGVVGLTWALFAAGCPTEVVSQWSVDDACTASLMARFYAGLKAGKAKGAALHEAARATANDGVAAHRHPYYWAPFVLFGEWK